MTSGRLPNFIIIGAAKCGTTSIHKYLEQHPEIFMSETKEPRYFAVKDVDGIDFSRAPWTGTVATLEEYRSLFSDVKDEKAIGESSPLYLGWSEVAAGNIQSAIPDVKLIAFLRQPAERAYSHFLHDIKIGVLNVRGFNAYLRKIPDNMYLGLSEYYKLLKPFYALFDPSQIKVFLFEDLIQFPDQLFEDIFTFLGVDPDVSIDIGTKHNQAAAPRWRTLHEIYTSKRVSRLANVMPAAFGKAIVNLRDRNLRSSVLDQKHRKKITERYFENDILRLQGLLNRDLTQWLI